MPVGFFSPVAVETSVGVPPQPPGISTTVPLPALATKISPAQSTVMPVGWFQMELLFVGRLPPPFRLAGFPRYTRRLLPVSAKYRLLLQSTATPRGAFSATPFGPLVPRFSTLATPAAVTSTTLLLTESTKKTFPKASVATCCGLARPVDGAGSVICVGNSVAVTCAWPGNALSANSVAASNAGQKLS